MTSQYETNLWSTHVNIVRLAEPTGAAFACERRFSKSRGLSASVSFFPSPSPHFHFLALVSFLARPKPRIPFLGLSLLRNQTETLATQTIWSLKTRCKHKFVWESKYSPFVQLKLLNFDPFCVIKLYKLMNDRSQFNSVLLPLTVY